MILFQYSPRKTRKCSSISLEPFIFLQIIWFTHQLYDKLNLVPNFTLLELSTKFHLFNYRTSDRGFFFGFFWSSIINYLFLATDTRSHIFLNAIRNAFSNGEIIVFFRAKNSSLMSNNIFLEDTVIFQGSYLTIIPSPTHIPP